MHKNYKSFSLVLYSIYFIINLFYFKPSQALDKFKHATVDPLHGPQMDNLP
jgi:hypothetical protein